MSANTHPHVAAFGTTGRPPDQVVCVRVEAGAALGVWIGLAWPGVTTHVINNPEGLDRITIDQARLILEGWPATYGNAGDAIQSAAWHGRQELIAARLHAKVAAPIERPAIP